MARKTDVPFPIIKSLGNLLHLAAVELIDIDVENLGAVQGDFDRLTADFDLLIIPLSNRA